jgi:hypothetical protein
MYILFIRVIFTFTIKFVKLNYCYYQRTTLIIFLIFSNKKGDKKNYSNYFRQIETLDNN